MRAPWLVVLAACGPAKPVQPAEPVAREAPAAPVVVADAAPVADAAVVAPPQAAVSGKLKLLADLPAWGIAAVRGKVVVIDDGFKTVTAVDASTGAHAWHVALETEAKGMHSLVVLPTGLAAWFGPVVNLLDPATGKAQQWANAPWNGTPWNDGGCWLDSTDGVCAWRCQCSYQVVDCAAGTAIGKHYEQNYVEMFPQHGPPSAGCWGPGASTLGRAGKLAVIRTEDAHGAHSPLYTIALDAAGGEAWRVQGDEGGDPARSGMSPDHATCWFGGFDGALAVRDCATGKLRWQVAKDPQPVPLLVTFVPPHGLYELRGRRASLYDERSGKLRWRVEVPAGAVAWPGGLVPALEFGFDDATAVMLLDPATGKPGPSLPRTDHGDVVPLASGVVIATDAIRRYDTSGKQVARVDLKAGIVVGGDRVLAVTGTEVVGLDLATLAELGRITGKFSEYRLDGELGPRRALLWAYDGKTIGRAILVELGS